MNEPKKPGRPKVYSDRLSRSYLLPRELVDWLEQVANERECSINSVVVDILYAARIQSEQTRQQVVAAILTAKTQLEQSSRQTGTQGWRK